MDELKTKVDNLAEDVGNYAETFYKLAVVNVTEKTSTAASAGLTSICVALLTMFALLFAGFGLSWWIGEALENFIAGFFIVAGVYCVLIALVFIFRKKYILPFIRNYIIQKIYG